MMEHATQQILLVDDREANLLALEQALTRPHLSILTASSGNEALSLLLDHPVALILMDVQMPGMDGFETAELIRGNPNTCRIPIIFVTAINTETRHIFKGFDAGAVDYLSKPLELETLTRKVNVFLELHEYQQSLVATTRELTETVATLREANSRIQSQQKKILQEERLKVLLQMAGAMAHELSQPLMALQGNIQLMNLHRKTPEKLPVYVDRIDESGRRIAEIIRKIQTLHVDDTLDYAGDTSIINLDQTINVLVVGEDGREDSPLRRALSTLNRLSVTCVDDAKGARSALDKENRDLLFISRNLPDGPGDEAAQRLTAPSKTPPFVIISEATNKLTTSRLIRQGAFEVLERSLITPETIRTLLHRALDAVMPGSTLAAMDRTDEASLRDPRTGLYTRHCFENLLHRDISRAHRKGQGLALLLVRLDNFDEVIATYGPEAGDMVLGSLGSLLGDMIRTGDLAGRFDHETFAVLLNGIAVAEVPGISHRFTETLTKKEFLYNAFRFNLALRSGAGILAPGTPGTAEELILEAREALSAATADTCDR
ncbi:hypothetical protein DSLASN_22330 [Desulfoluna limicola]|uniref:histidine kinase n=1 Tax=Desulfoluna limicola TaxID=2810562 RepID=A0ABM7PG85_9BACT|nr:response regulator [Desulfoluna limicola]BCS96601.1 hypothetical protein DSLASN_22330 [Desulfoluna limicola]